MNELQAPSELSLERSRCRSAKSTDTSNLANFGLEPLTEASIESPEHRDIVQLAELLILEDSVQSADTTTELLGVFPVSVMHSDKTIHKSMRI